MITDYRELLDQARQAEQATVALRRRLHEEPEIGLDLPRTQAAVLEALDSLGLELSCGTGLSSVVGVLRGDRPGPAVLLRADMDALALHEDTGLDFASRNPEVMHACGHDLHTAMLVQAAHLLAARRADLAGTVVFMFQPGEEGHDGARLMVDEGLLEVAGTPIIGAYGLHVVSAGLASGQIQTRPGPITSGNDELSVVLHGSGGHGASPHLSRDPVPALAETITALQSMVTRRYDVFDPVVLTVGVVQAGTFATIIPASARLEATIRTFSRETRTQVAADIRQLCEGIALAHGLRAEITVAEKYPPTINDPDCAALVNSVAEGLLGPDRLTPLDHPIAGSEDFSRVLDAVPGAFWFLGAAVGPDPQQCANNHSSQAVFDEAVLPVGSALHAAIALEALRRERS